AALANDGLPQGTAGAACSGAAWTYSVNCPLQKIPPTVSGGIDATTAGDFAVERPTLASLGFDWRISGDENRNAKVEIQFRRRGNSPWHAGLPLLRLQGEKLTTGTPPLKYVVPNMFSGSLFDLQPDTDYEVHLTLSDPDGVSGEREKTVTVHTRAEPRPAAGG